LKTNYRGNPYDNYKKVEVVSKAVAPTQSAEECSGKKCAGYRGNQNKTKGGFTCMKWTS